MNTGVNINMLKECLYELSSLELQHRMWLYGSDAEQSSFSELVSQLFDDTGLCDQINSLSFEDYIGKNVVQKLKELDKLISYIDQTESPELIINHPKMSAIRKVAQDILDIIGR
jgi:hypothetical protein